MWRVSGGWWIDNIQSGGDSFRCLLSPLVSAFGVSSLLSRSTHQCHPLSPWSILWRGACLTEDELHYQNWFGSKVDYFDLCFLGFLGGWLKECRNVCDEIAPLRILDSVPLHFSLVPIIILSHKVFDCSVWKTPLWWITSVTCQDHSHVKGRLPFNDHGSATRDLWHQNVEWYRLSTVLNVSLFLG